MECHPEGEWGRSNMRIESGLDLPEKWEAKQSQRRTNKKKCRTRENLGYNDILN